MPEQTSQQGTTSTTGSLDQDAVTLAKAIRQTESGGNFQARGKSGEFGAYQFTPDTWKVASSKYLGQEVPLEQATPSQQNEVAYKQIKEWKDAGNNIGQVASMWNAGEKHANAYKENYKGVNAYGVQYDTPAYAKSVATAYQKLKQGQQVGIDTQNPSAIGTQYQPTQETSQDQSIGEKLSNRVGDLSTAISDFTSGKQGLVSTGIQAAGAIAGGLGDIVNKGLELIPGFKQLEGVVGQGVQSLAQTDSGKEILSSVQKFNEEHPELSKDIGAGFNILTAIPILKGLGVVKNVALDGASLALKNVAENVAEKDLTAIAAKTVGGRTALTKAPDAIKTLIQERAIPDIVENKYTTKEAFDKLGQNISQIENTELQPALNNIQSQLEAKTASQYGSYKAFKQGFNKFGGDSSLQSIDDLKNEAINTIKKEFKGTGESLSAIKETERKFENFKSEFGDFVSLKDVNDMKRGIRDSVNFNSPKLQSDVSYQLGQVFQKNIEDKATQLGLGDINAINKKMADLIKAQNMLKHIEGKPVKMGIVGTTIKGAATIGGEMAGEATGIPLAGTLMGRQIGGSVGKKLTGITEGILKRTGKGLIRPSLTSSAKKAAGLVSATIAQKQNQ